MTKSTVTAIVAGALVLGGSAWLAVDRGGNLAAGLVSGIVVLGAVVATVFIRKRRERTTLSQEPDSVEHHAAAGAQAGAFRDLLIIGAAGFLAGAVWPQLPAAGVAFGILLVTVVAFWVRYTLSLRSVRA